MIGSVGDDKSIILWDTRDAGKQIHTVKAAHEDDINCIAFNPRNEHVFATGSADKTVAVWDVRNLKRYDLTRVQSFFLTGISSIM